ncbi:TPA: tail fiber assembly protein [Escherichia coli]|nr:tail fiber assembly protein [Escherichia coli]
MTINYFYSSENNAFYAAELKSAYIEAGSWPNDALEVSDECFSEFTSEPPEGVVRGAGDDGLPLWLQILPPSQENLIASAANTKNSLIIDANNYINDKQWPSKLALGRLNDEDKIEFNLWLDYLDALESVEVSTAPDIEWPVKPD